MWLFTRHGFYSVVRDRVDTRHVQVRARIKDDLERLSHFAGKVLRVEMPEIIPTPQADYAFRCVIEQEGWVKIAAALAADIDYTNFKGEIHGDERAATEASMRPRKRMTVSQEQTERNGNKGSRHKRAFCTHPVLFPGPLLSDCDDCAPSVALGPTLGSQLLQTARILEPNKHRRENSVLLLGRERAALGLRAVKRASQL
jgi:hypothetical protein